MSIEILKKYGIKAKKSLGQNFLVNSDIVQQISNILEISGKNIVEVGPGYGALTEELIQKKPLSLSLVELDIEMIDILNNRIQNNDFELGQINFSINNVDVLKYNPEFEKYFLIANIPYYITSPILRHFLYDIPNKPETMVVLMQKDVGDKILGKNKNKSSVISLFVQKKCNVSEKIFVGKQNFIPPPKIESSVLLFEIHNDFENIPDDLFLEFIKKGFREPRKKLIKNFTNSGYDKNLILECFEELSIENGARGEDLNISIWCVLFEKINN